ncbi:MAG: stringent starvation protein A [Halothiobacillaceae bacterium]|nr:MAG: stringent starvation protein A [Halothiobacillaceae bacterium]
MATSASRRGVMTLFSHPECPESHRTRIVLAEKELTADMVEVNPAHPPEDFIDLSPSGTLPTLVDRDLVLTNARVIMEYLDERFPHPPLMPIDPVSRAKVRTALYTIEREWYPLLPELAEGGKGATKARKTLREGLLSIIPLFAATPFLMSDEFSLADASLAPILWRLPVYGIELPANAKALNDYMERVFNRETFRQSLSDLELEMR